MTMAASRVGKILHKFFLIPLLLYTSRATAAVTSARYHADASAETKVGVMHYGSYETLGITCQRDELIMITSETLGYSMTSACVPEEMCSVPYTLAKWFCRGKSTCDGIPVERRPLHKRTCGSEFTNCLRIEYHCVKREYHRVKRKYHCVKCQYHNVKRQHHCVKRQYHCVKRKYESCKQTFLL